MSVLPICQKQLNLKRKMSRPSGRPETFSNADELILLLIYWLLPVNVYSIQLLYLVSIINIKL